MSGNSEGASWLNRGKLSFFRAWAVIFFVGTTQLALSSEVQTDQMAQRLIQVWKTLRSLPSGLALVESAQKIWKLDFEADFLKHIKLGDSSRTDTVLTRYFSAYSGKEERQREVVIFLRENQSDAELLLDLSHELVHATSRAIYDPYDPNLSAVQFILNGIDGEGGEVDAVLKECAISQEMTFGNGGRAHRCSHYYDLSFFLTQSVHSLSRSLVAQDFYRVGQWLPEIQKQLGSETRFLPLLRNEAPRWLSSTAHAPYPVALFQEYEEMTQAACRNSLERKRVHHSHSSDRKPTQDGAIERLLATRCHDGIPVASK